MLQDLPPDCLRLIIRQLPTASSLCNLAATSRFFYSQIAADEYGIFRGFVQNAFPSLKTSPPWRDAAIGLTSRARAWDRRAFIARECWNSSTDWTDLSSHSRHGFVPAIDSYETSSGDVTAPRKDVMAHSAAGRVMIRVNHSHGPEWREIRFENDGLPENDILDLHLLRPHQQSNLDEEVVVFRRANGEVAQLSSSSEHDPYAPSLEYAFRGTDVDSIAISNDRHPLLGICSASMLYVYPIYTEDAALEPPNSFQLSDPSDVSFQRRCANFLSSNILATGIHHLEGRTWAPIQVYDLNAQPSSHHVTDPLHTLTASNAEFRSRQGVNTLTQLEGSTGKSANLLLSGWTDGVSRLYDLRSPRQPVASYHDTVDDGQILSLASLGHERFLAGSHQNACLKTFDLRMPGAKPYSHKTLPTPPPPPQTSLTSSRPSHRDFNIFLAPPSSTRPYTWHPISQQARSTQHPRYRGPIYSLSSPSSTSPTIYAGITNHVLQLDFVSTDDIFQRPRFIDPMLHLTPDTPVTEVIALSCYERPREGFESTDPVLLRKQRGWSDVKTGQTHRIGEVESGLSGFGLEDSWDERWYAISTRTRGDDDGRGFGRRWG